MAQGSGTLLCGGETFELHGKDVAAIPAWTWHQVIAGDDELVLFRVTDRRRTRRSVLPGRDGPGLTVRFPA